MSKLVMTLLVCDEADIVRQNIEFHLHGGVDFIIATDNGSVDGTREILVEYQRVGALHLIDEPGNDFSQAKWVTRMALMARDRFGADWILNSDADEFWWAQSGELKSDLERPRTGMLECQRRNMLCAHDGERSPSWSLDLIYRVAQPRPIPLLDDRMTSPFPYPYLYFNLPPKVLCPADGLRFIEQGNHDAKYPNPWRIPSENIRIYHYPVRSRQQFEKKVRRGGAAYASNQTFDASIGWHWRRWYGKWQEGAIGQAFEENLPSRWQLESDLARGSVVEDRSMSGAIEGDRTARSRTVAPTARPHHG